MNPIELAKIAVEAATRAYAPYSKFKVGAALLAENGEIYTGCNVENASYGMSICAERVAVAKAITEGVKSFQAIAVSTKGSAAPCGACRQVLAEFNPTMQVYIADEMGNVAHETTLDTLIPHAFGPENL
jgi:cytidine deaminase